jgi:queuine tRNA-ribosyltransferase
MAAAAVAATSTFAEAMSLPPPPVNGPPLTLRIDATCGRARATTIVLPHGTIATPVFMPVGTKGSVKGLVVEQLEAPPLDLKILLGNTYHLGSHPGPEVLRMAGGLHGLMGWSRNILTDSGGFQMVSLLKLARITEEGVNFEHPEDGKQMMLTPEKSIELQNAIGSDIMMMLDDVVSSVSPDAARFAEATARTTRWLDRCIRAHARPTEQCLFAIVQGGLDVSSGGLREQSLCDLQQRDPWLGGYAIGGLAGGEAKHDFIRVVEFCTRASGGLPAEKPRYCMGVGYPVDLVVCVALGVDMFDCVYPTRTARFGVALTAEGPLRLKHAQYATDHRRLDAEFGHPEADRFGRSALRSLLLADAGSSAVACSLISLHNLAYMAHLTRRMRTAIIDGSFPLFVRSFMARRFPAGVACEDGGQRYPQWVTSALQMAGVDLAPTTM